MHLYEMIIMILLGYLIGSIPFSYLVPKWLGNIDIRKHGSGNTGTTNVVRTLGLKVGLIAFVGDFFKGLIPSWIGFSVFGLLGGILGGGFSVVGHCYSVWLKFNGGKGIATSAGVIAIVFPILFPILLIFQFGIILSTRLMSLASVSSGVLLPILTFFIYPSIERIVFSILLGAFVIYRHRANLLRLINGTENKLGAKKDTD